MQVQVLSVSPCLCRPIGRVTAFRPQVLGVRISPEAPFLLMKDCNMKRQAPRFCVADKKGQQVFVGDRITWWTDSYYEGGRTPRMNEGIVIGFRQHFYRHWRNPTKWVWKDR